MGLVVAFGWAVSGSAQPVAKADEEIAFPVPDEDERTALPLLQSINSGSKNIDEQLRSVAKALEIASKPTPFRGLIRCQQAYLAGQQDDTVQLYEEAAKECIALLPDHPAAQTIYSYYQMGRDLTGGEGLAEGVDLMTRVLLKHPQFAAEVLHRPVLYSVIRRLRYANDQRRMVSLVDAYIASGIAKANDVATDDFVMIAIDELIAQKKWSNAIALLGQLKTRRSVEALLLQRDAEPIWMNASQYYHGALEQRRNLFDLDSWRSAGGTYGELTPDRIAAMAEHGEWEKLRNDAASLLAIQTETYDWDRGETFFMAISAMFRGGRSDLAFPLGLQYFGKLGAQGNENLNGKLTLGHELVKAGRAKEGMALIDEGYAHWTNNQSMTEGSGGRIFMAAVRSCALGTAEGEAAYQEVLAERGRFSGPYRAALECRNSAVDLAIFFEEVLNGADVADRSKLIVELRRIQANQNERSSPAAKKALASSRVLAALDKVSRSWAVATMKSVPAKAEADK